MLVPSRNLVPILGLPRTYPSASLRAGWGCCMPPPSASLRGLGLRGAFCFFPSGCAVADLVSEKNSQLWAGSQNPPAYAARVIIGMLRLRSEARFALLTAPLSMTPFWGWGWVVRSASFPWLRWRALHFGAESSGGREVKIPQPYAACEL